MPDGSTETQSAPLAAGSPCLQGERVAFTGTLASMTHREALERVAEHGGTPMQHVSRQLTMLVVGEEGWPLEADGRPSQKLLQVAGWRQEGLDIRLLNESEWLHLLGLSERRQDVHELYTPAMLCQLLDIPVSRIRRWERLGMIRPVRKLHRLPYFDYAEVTHVRRVAELLDSGVPAAKIESGLARLNELLDAGDRPRIQLDLVALGSRLLYRDDAGLLETTSGQRCFDFESTSAESDSPGDVPSLSVADRDDQSTVAAGDPRVRWSVEEWFQEGCRLLDDSHCEQAIEAFRLCLMEQPADSGGGAETNFYLAEALYRAENPAGALERYYAAVEADHEYIEAWTQIGCLHAELGDLQQALDAFKVALDVHPDYPDAHLHAADVLYQLGRTAEAVPHWQTYLKFVDRGPWAETARQRLEEAEADSLPTTES